MVLSQDEGIFYRAVVLSQTGSDLSVHFVDYGNNAIAPISAVFPVSDEIEKIPQLCFRCTAAEG